MDSDTLKTYNDIGVEYLKLREVLRLLALMSHIRVKAWEGSERDGFEF